jgi:Phospholipase_D-nuclease N-terminal
LDWNFGDILLTMFALFFWVTFLWIFFAAFADIFRRSDLSGWAKAGWIILICVLPLIGVLAYMIARPPVTREDVIDLQAVEASRVSVPGYSTADEIAKLSRLQEEGKISTQEYQELKLKVLA